MLGAPVTVTPPTASLISTEQAMTFLRIDGEILDAEVELMVAAAIGELELTTGLRLLNQVVRVTADSFNDLLRFRVGPVRSIASVAYRDTTGAEQVLAPASYELFGSPFEQGLQTAIGHSWPAVLSRSSAINVTLNVGYGDTPEAVPAHLRLAAFSILRGRHDGAEVNVESLIANDRFWL